MKILHYSLGLPPYRTGGLTKYSYDLMMDQKQKGNEVILLFPGFYSLFNPRTRISKKKVLNGLNVYEVINPLPVPLLNGIKNPDKFFKATDISIYFDFLKKINVDVIHIHTLMGLHKEFMLAAKKLNIKMIFTTHDYFGLCPKVNFIDYQGISCSGNEDFRKCYFCNYNGYSMKLIYIMQSKRYRALKYNKIIAKLRSLKNRNINKKLKETSLCNELPDNITIENYKKLKDYYYDMFRLVDYFHFNSTLSKNIYNNFLECNGEVINITHSGIDDNRKLKDYHKSNFNLLYIGPLESYKGFYLLKESLESLVKGGLTNFLLDVYGNNIEMENTEYINFHGKYTYDQLNKIYDRTDLLIIPSLWNETFGYTGLEALSNGVPVLLTQNVGFKDVIDDGKTGIIVKAQQEDLINALRKVLANSTTLEEINKNICNMKFHYYMQNHTFEILNLYKNIINKKVG